MAEPTYPFLFPNHGPIDPECIGKCAELWMWFARDVTPAERKKIEERAPPPLSCFMGWDRRFAYFGSAGDSYDAEVIQHYCPPELVTAIAEATSNQDWTRVGKLYQKAQDHFDEAAVAFAMDVERWAREVHEIAPLVVFFGPHGGGGDDDAWHRHSQRALGRVMLPVLAEYQASAEGKRCFGYIKKVVQGHLSRHADEVDLDELRPGLMASIEDGYRSADLSVPFGRLLSSSDAPLQHLGANVQRALSDLPDGERRAWIERLSPFARLCYLASYSAAGSRDLDRFGDLPSYLRGLLAELPRERAHLGPWLLLWTAETLAQDTCAFDKKKRDTSRAGDAAQVLDVALELPGAVAWMWAEAVRYRSWAGRHQEAIEVARRALARFPHDRMIAADAVAAAKAAQKARTKGGKAAEREFAEAVEQARTLDPDAFVSKSVALAGKKKLAEMLKLFIKYLAAGGQRAPAPVCNGLYPLIEGVVPDPAFVEGTLAELIEAAATSQAFRLHDQAIVQIGVVLDKFPQHRARFVRLALPHLHEPGAGLHAQLLWHAHTLADQDAVDHIMARIDEQLAIDPDYLDRQTYTLQNLAEFAAERGQRERALGYLRRLQGADPSRFLAAHREEGLRSLWDDDEYEALFGKKKAKAKAGKKSKKG